MSSDASYVPGGWVAVSGPGCWLLIDLAPDAASVEKCWSLISQGAGADDILDAVVADGISRAPAFALVHVDGAEMRVFVRGLASAVPVDGEPLSGRGLRTWREVALERCEVTLHSPDESHGVSLPMAAGVTMACTVRIGAQPRQTVVPVPAPRMTEAAPAPTGAREPETPPDAVAVGAEDDGGTYDHLFGATQRPGAVPPVPADTVAPEASPTGATAAWTEISNRQPDPVVAPAAPVAPATTAPLSTPDESPAVPAVPAGGVIDVIDVMPWASPAHAVRPETLLVSDVAPSLPPGTGRGYEQTVNRAELLAAAAGASVQGSGPMVIAGLCPDGHLSSLHGSACRVCGRPMPEDQVGFEVARPPLGVLRLSTGDVITLDRPVYLGRAPEVPSDVTEQPHAVRLSSPDNDISRTHARIDTDGWHVYVVDLGSTNGTVVTLPGQAPQRLRAHDPHLLERGATVGLADEVTLTFEVSA